MCACAAIVALALLVVGGAAADRFGPQSPFAWPAPTRAPTTPWTPHGDERYELVFMSSRQHAGKLIAGAFLQSFADARANAQLAPLFARLAPGPKYEVESSYNGTTLGALHAMTERYLRGRRRSQMPRHLILAFFGTRLPSPLPSTRVTRWPPRITAGDVRAGPDNEDNSCESEARLASAWNIPLLGYVRMQVLSRSQFASRRLLVLILLPGATSIIISLHLSHP